MSFANCVFVLSRCFLDFSVSVGAFVIGLCQISSFFSGSFVFYNVHSYGLFKFVTIKLMVTMVNKHLKYTMPILKILYNANGQLYNTNPSVVFTRVSPLPELIFSLFIQI